jgi:nitrite reductase/ring-hydroxylating ferredoxin subunit
MTDGVRTSLNPGVTSGTEASPLIALSALADGVPAEVEATVDGSAESLIVLRRGGQVRAWLNICPHAGRRLDWAPGRFLLSKGQLVCAAHGATFEPDAGLCVAGPCRGQSLRAVAVAVIGDGVFLATP